MLAPYVQRRSPIGERCGARGNSVILCSRAKYSQAQPEHALFKMLSSQTAKPHRVSYRGAFSPEARRLPQFRGFSRGGAKLTETVIPDWADSNVSKELPVLRSRGEGQEIEYMESFPKQVHDLAKEIAAFASCDGGTILIGVSDDGEVKGLDAASTTEERDIYLRRIEGICRGPVKPAITPTVKYAYDDGKSVIVIFVAKGSQPIYYSNGKPYVRHITESRPAEPHEVIELIRRSLAPDQIGKEEVDPFSQLVSELSSVIIEVLIYAEEAEQRYCNPWLDMWRSQFAQSASDLRDIAVDEIAIKKGLADEINELAKALDAVANFIMTMGCWPELKLKIKDVLEKSKAIKVKWIDGMPLSQDSVNQIKRRIVELARKLSNLSERAQDEDYIFRKTEDFQSEASEIGHLLLRISYYILDSIKEGLSSELQPIARDLHLIETERLYLDGGHSINKLVERVKKDSGMLMKLLQ